jgi:hypothetical protein
MRVDPSFQIFSLASLMILALLFSPALVSQPVRAAGEPQATLLAPVAPQKWISGAGVTAATPQPPGRDAAWAAGPTPSFSLPVPGLPDRVAALPDLNSPENAPPWLPGMPAIAARASSAPTEPHAWTCQDYGVPCWVFIGQSPSSCFVDPSKRALRIGLVYPVYQWQIPLAQGRAWIYHRFWVWNPTTQKWSTNGWSSPYMAVVNTNYEEVFLKNQFSLDDLGYVGSPGPYVAPIPVLGAVGPTWVMIERYVYLSGVLDEPLTSVSSWVTFDIGSRMCGYNFPGTAQSVAALAPTPPGQGGASLSNIFLPLIVRPPGSGAVPTPTTPTATPTLNMQLPPTPSGPSTTGDMRNADFEAGRNNGWSETSTRGYAIVRTGPAGFAARSGQYLAWLGGAHNETSIISQTLTVPASHPYLSLYLMASSEEDSCYYDRATIWADEYQVATIGLCKPLNFHSWLRGQIDMRAFAGQKVAFAIKVETDDTLLSHVFLDDLTFESGVVLPTATPTPAVTPTRTPTAIPTLTATPTRTQTPIPSSTPTRAPTVTPLSTSTPTRTSTPDSGSASIRNPGFELGDNGDWGSGSSSGNRNICSNGGAHTGGWLAWLGGAHNEDGYIEQTLYIPHDRPYLTYWGWVSSQEATCGGDYVSFLVGSTELFRYNLCTQYNSSRWWQDSANLKAYSGTTQKIRIRIQTNGTLLSSLYLDDFAFAIAPPASGIASGLGAESAGDHGAPGGAEAIQTDGRVPARRPESKEPAR